MKVNTTKYCRCLSDFNTQETFILKHFINFLKPVTRYDLQDFDFIA